MHRASPDRSCPKSRFLFRKSRSAGTSRSLRHRARTALSSRDCRPCPLGTGGTQGCLRAYGSTTGCIRITINECFLRHTFRERLTGKNGLVVLDKGLRGFDFSPVADCGCPASRTRPRVDHFHLFRRSPTRSVSPRPCPVSARWPRSDSPTVKLDAQLRDWRRQYRRRRVPHHCRTAEPGQQKDSRTLARRHPPDPDGARCPAEWRRRCAPLLR